MKKAPTYEELLVEIAMLRDQNKRMNERIAYLERLLYGAKSDRIASKVPENQPGLFDEFFKEAMDEKARQIEQAAKDIEQAAQRRRQAARKSPSRPAKYRYFGLEERTTTIMPEGVDADQYDIIGKDGTSILHPEPAQGWG